VVNKKEGLNSEFRRPDDYQLFKIEKILKEINSWV
jgi:hypothetical protein